ncbi:hypothetical protein OG389_31255 [Streptomyces sp. NBC_00435]|uniref:hypothetical protein n=1 Tax=Streptomyces sp. NBC_00435 TaxID=2903649 RepID=UPI002E24AA17
MKRLLMKTAMVTAATVAATLIPLAGTSYAAGCSGAGCDNLGPVGQGCDADAVTQRSVGGDPLKAELRWSAKCQAGWVRGSDNGNGNNWWDHYAYIEKHNGIGGPLIRSLQVKIPVAGSDWSNMVGGTNYYYRVCVTTSSPDSFACSSYF